MDFVLSSPKCTCLTYYLQTNQPKLKNLYLINFLFERFDVYHLIVSSVKPRKRIFKIKICGQLYQTPFVNQEPFRSGD